MPKKKYFPWHKEPCHHCGTEFLLTRGNPMEIDVTEEILCEGCEMHQHGYKEGIECADSKLRQPLRSFAWIMEEQLKKNDYKGEEGWKDNHIQELFSKLLEEVQELHVAVRKSKEVDREAADVANIAMMISDVMEKDVKRRKKVMWDLIEAAALVRVLNKNLQPLGWGIGIVGSVLSEGYSDNDLDLVVFPHDTCCAMKEVLYMALEAEGLTCKYNVDKVRAAWRKQGSNDSKHVEVWEDRTGKRIDLFLLA